MPSQRRTHVGKSRYEKEAYGRFLGSDTPLDETEKVPLDDSETRSLAGPGSDSGGRKARPASFKIKLFDWVRDNLIPVIFTGVVLTVLLPLYISLNREVGIIGSSVEMVKSKIDSIEGEGKKGDEALQRLDKDFSVYKAEMKGEISAIKELLEKVRLRLKI